MILFIVPLAAWLYNQAADIATGVGDFLRSIPSYFAPKPAGLSAPYTPPFTGGQCNTIYRFSFTQTAPSNAPTFYDGTRTRRVDRLDIGNSTGGRVTGIDVGSYNGYVTMLRVGFIDSSGNQAYRIASTGGGDYQSVAYTYTDVSFVRLDGSSIECGNLPNPTPPPSISDDGLFKPTNTYITDSNDVVNESAIVLAPALPLVLVAAITGGYMAAMAAAKAALDALEAIKKVAEGLEALKKLWDKLQEFLDEWEKTRPKKRDITRQTYGQILGDGALDFFAPNSKKVEAIQLDIVVTSIPSTRGKYFGNLSPHRYRYGQYLSERELGYIAFYSVNQGILEVHSIQFKRTTLEIPKLAVGFIYHFGLDNQIKAFAFGTFSIEKT